MKVKERNNWEYLTYEFKGKELDEKKGGTAILNNGEKVPFKSIVTYGHYNDMGHKTTVERHELIATIKYNNQKIKVKLKELNVKEIKQ